MSWDIVHTKVSRFEQTYHVSHIIVASALKGERKNRERMYMSMKSIQGTSPNTTIDTTTNSPKQTYQFSRTMSNVVDSNHDSIFGS